jgi:hypothetical protein
MFHIQFVSHICYNLYPYQGCLQQEHRSQNITDPGPSSITPPGHQGRPPDPHQTPISTYQLLVTTTRPPSLPTQHQPSNTRAQVNNDPPSPIERHPLTDNECHLFGHLSVDVACLNRTIRSETGSGDHRGEYLPECHLRG